MNISRPIGDIGSMKRVLAKHLGTIEERFGPYQIELTRRLLDGIESRESQSLIAHLRKFCGDQWSHNYFNPRNHFLDALP
jgi:hypothetical protein